MESTESEKVEESTQLLPWISIQNEPTDKLNKYGGLVYLDSLKKFYFYKNIQLFDKLFDSPKMTRNCLTVRNQYFQQIYYIGSEGNRSPGTIMPFTLRFIDQYNRFLIKIKKYFKHCFGEQVIDIECPPGVLKAKMVQNNNPNNEYLFTIYGPKRTDIRFFITRNEEKKSLNEFTILNEKKRTIATICKRYEKVLALGNIVAYEDHYIKLNIKDNPFLDVFDKAVLLSSVPIVEIFLMTTK